MPPGWTGYALYRFSISNRDDQEALVPFSAQTNTSGTLVFDEIAASTAFAFVNPLAQAGTIVIVAYRAMELRSARQP